MALDPPLTGVVLRADGAPPLPAAGDMRRLTMDGEHHPVVGLKAAHLTGENTEMVRRVLRAEVLPNRLQLSGHLYQKKRC